MNICCTLESTVVVVSSVTPHPKLAIAVDVEAKF